MIKKEIKKFIDNKEVFFSLEFFPPKNEESLSKLNNSFDKLKDFNILFSDVTCGAGGSTKDGSLSLAKKVKEIFSHEVVLHVTLTGSSTKDILNYCDEAVSFGVNNFLALRGDPLPQDLVWQPHKDGPKNTLDFIKILRNRYGKECSIGVSGYPTPHSDSISLKSDMKYLKSKAKAGADFIVSQFFFNFEDWVNFKSICDKYQIQKPILPGILLPTNYEQLIRILNMSKVPMNKDIMFKLEESKNDKNKFRSVILDLNYELCKNLIDFGVPGLHLYTLNNRS